MIIPLLPNNAYSASADDNQVFSDISDNEYYADAAVVLAQLGILQGYPDGTFGADRDITRAEMTAIVLRSLDLEGEAKESPQRG